MVASTPHLSNLLACYSIYPPPGMSPEKFAASIEDIFEDRPHTKDWNIQIFLGLEDVNLTSGSVRWRMSKFWDEKMKSENWKMVAYRTDFRFPGAYRCIC